MICHVVLIRLRPDTPSQEASTFLQDARRTLGAIPGVRHLRVGKALESENDHPFCLVMDFEDREALEAYQIHPEHRRFVDEILGPHVKDKKVLDYTCSPESRI